MIAPSLLLCDFGHLADEVRKLEDAGAQSFHLDVMDGHFVPNLTYGMPIVEAVRRVTQLPIDTHLMISDPLRYAEDFCSAGANLVTFHIEATSEPRAVLEQIRGQNALAGIAINPETPLTALHGCLDVCDVVMVMGVHPGFGGQKFEPATPARIAELRGRVGSNVLLEVDGGINSSTIGLCAQAGAEIFVVGSAIFGSDDYARRVAELAAAAPVS